MAYPPHGQQPPSPPDGPAPGNQYGHQPPYGGQAPYGGQPPYPAQPPHPGHTFPAPGQYNPHAMPPPGGKSGSSGTAVAVIVIIVAVLVLGGGAGAYLLLSSGSTSSNTDSTSEAVTDTDSDEPTDDSSGTVEEARFSIGAGPDDAPEVVIFADYNCPGCHAFDYENGDVLRAAAYNGEIQLDIVTVNLTGEATNPEDYSSQAAEVAACVYEVAPEEFGEFHGNVMLESHTAPEQAISIDNMTSLASNYGADQAVTECLREGEKANQADVSTAYAEDNGVTLIPTVWVDEEVTDTEDVLDAIS